MVTLHNFGIFIFPLLFWRKYVVSKLAIEPLSIVIAIVTEVLEAIHRQPIKQTPRFEELKFAYADGCVQCAGVAYDMYPKWGWSDFCKAFAESKVVRDSFFLALKILDGSMPQPFKIRSAVDSSASLGVRLEQPYIALTQEEVLSLFKLPPEAFDTDLKQVTLSSESGEPTLYYLFEHGFRTAFFYSLNRLQLQELLLEPQKQLRKEQPFERYQVLAKQQVEARKPLPPPGIKVDKKNPKILSIDEAHARAAAIIAARQEKETRQTVAGGDVKPSEFEEELERELAHQFDFAQIETVESQMTPAGEFKKEKGAKASKRKTAPGAKASTAKKPARIQPGTAERQSKQLPDPAKSPRSLSPSVRGGGEDPVAEDQLALDIRSKIGGDVRSVSNLDVERVLRGEALGRSLNGVPGLKFSSQHCS